MEKEQEKTPCFVGLTKPIMKGKVPLMYFGLNAFGHIFAVILGHLYLVAPLSFGFFWLVGIWLAKIEPFFTDILLAKLRCCRLDNYLFWGCNSYGP